MVTLMHAVIFFAAMAYVWYARMVAMRIGVAGTTAARNPTEEEARWISWNYRFGLGMCLLCLIVMTAEFIYPVAYWIMLLVNCALLASVIFLITRLSFKETLD